MCRRLLKPTKDLICRPLTPVWQVKEDLYKCKVPLALYYLMIYLCLQASDNVHLVHDKWLRPYLSVQAYDNFHLVLYDDCLQNYAICPDYKK